MSSLVPYQQGLLIPPDWRAVGLVFATPGALSGYHGPAALALTGDALHVCGPSGMIQTIPFENIRNVDVCDLRGIVIERATSTGSVLTNPREAYGVEITHEPPGTIPHRARVLVYFYNRAAEWVAVIGGEVDGFNVHVIPTGAIQWRR